MNLDHDIFSKKAESLLLATKVEEFLKANNLSECPQVPFGKSSYSNNYESWNGGMQNAQTTMRNIMTSSVNKSRSQKLKSTAKPAIIETKKRQSENRDARYTALKNGEKSFTGECEHHGKTLFNIKCEGKKHYCRICVRENTARFKLKKELMACA